MVSLVNHQIPVSFGSGLEWPLSFFAPTRITAMPGFTASTNASPSLALLP